jgi:hypothetical protein
MRGILKKFSGELQREFGKGFGERSLRDCRQFYLTEAAANNWSVRTLDRNIATLYYQRLLSSRKKDLVIGEMQEKTAAFQGDKLEFIKNPAVLDSSVSPIISDILRRNWKKPLSTISSSFFLSWAKALPLCHGSSLYGQKPRNFISTLCFTILS